MSTLLEMNQAFDVSCRSDKYCHHYFEIYDRLFFDIRDRTMNILEIGVKYGGSLLLWEKYFPNATIYGIDDGSDVNIDLHSIDLPTRVNIIEANAYTEQMLDYMSYKKFGIIIDDGPHSKETQKFTAAKYSGLLEDEAVLVIEDIDSTITAKEICFVIPAKLKPRSYLVDLRHIRNAPDDQLLVIDTRNR